MTATSTSLSFCAIPGIGEIRPGDNLARLLVGALHAWEYVARHRDVFVIAQKVVSKAEGRMVDLRNVTPSPRALELARQTGKDPRLVETILLESIEVIRAAPDVLIVRHRLGFVMANAGIDRSNVESAPDAETVLLLPRDCDRAAAELRDRLSQNLGVAVGVIISDSFGRPWRKGVVNIALGAAGLPSVIDRRGERDRQGRALESTDVAFADAIAGGAALVMGEAGEGTPVVLARGLTWDAREAPAQELIRPVHADLFR